MKMRNTMLAAVGAASLLLGMSGAALAQTTAPVEVEIAADPDAALTVSIAATDFTGVTYSNTDQTATGSTLTVTAADTRGTAAGWSVTLSGSDFAGKTTNSIAVGNLGLTSGTVSGTGGTPPTGSSLAAVSGTAQTILSAGEGTGNGSYNQTLTGSLNVPGGTLVDTYSSTLTVTIAALAP